MSNKISTPIQRRRRDVRLRAMLILSTLVVAVGGGLLWFPSQQDGVSLEERTDEDHAFAVFDTEKSPGAAREEKVFRADDRWVDPAEDPKAHLRQATAQEVQARFQQAVIMLHAKRYAEAVKALERVLELAPNNADALTNIGYALIGLERHQEAQQAFEQAMDANPAQANAYYGAAVAMESQGNLEGALGGMRSFLHLSQDKSPTWIHIAQARSAIWEWEAKLGRGPWGPTRGIPPGFTEEELKRDDQGVGIKISIPGTENEEGLMQYEIKYGDKFELFDP